MKEFPRQEPVDNSDAEVVSTDGIIFPNTNEVVPIEQVGEREFSKDYGNERGLESFISFVLSRQDIQEKYFGGVLKTREKIETALVDDPELVGKILADTD